MVTPLNEMAFDLALHTNSDYVEDRDFRLKFLRCYDFDPRKSAECMMKHFHYKLDLFGRDKIAKDIELDDLSISAKASLYGGWFQCLYLCIWPNVS